MKSKVAALVATVGGLCALCCIVPVAGLLGFGALEAFLCDTPAAFWSGIGLMAIGLGYLGYKVFKRSCETSCATGCGCNPAS